ncbi:thiamine pyrophosphate-dependent dehydrogenase E1 component subunit alpha [Actinomadura spongiicola]|uniref:Thiamine pyrophosphate-dependent dehydrogenase E1 component subunit alpha n=1 Tax=Actinomadura spongiicola TaxID=2303421 RepID=A0A372GNB9_9ACTN|nr:thiamine pyrophosphate-dependent dehydrogenase E1 component subunit alpha [Actinomadura spongiicola]RFS86579.1 thiamine pyrophosphate-dependent dehydrogenase E1 component subunit alpha [Actinomadura spongiicola]
MTDTTVARRLYRTMARIRHFEVAAAKLMASGRLPGTLHVSIGQEAVAAGVCDVLRRDDPITTTHRGHGHCLAKGGEPKAMMAELLGRATGYCGGRSGSMHIADPAVGILGANAIVGAGIPIALGGAFAAARQGRGGVAVAFFGEGAVAQGVFHESLNLAALWKLPLVFVCENNQYVELTPVSVHLAARHVADHAAPYGVPGVRVDGNDATAVRSAAEEAVTRARDGGGPTLLECVTYRWHGHFEGDPQRYRDPAEVAEWKAADPLKRLAASMSGDSAEFAAIDEQARGEMADAVSAAEADPVASPASISAHVYRRPVGREVLA